MGFPPNIAEKALLDSGRHCCLCHKFCGFKIELHHIEQPVNKGNDSYDNCIPLCFDCHAEVKAYDPKHPKGRKYTESELRGHRDRWYQKVKNSAGIVVNSSYIDLDKKLFLEIRDILPSTGSISFIRHNNYAGFSFHLNQHDDLSNFFQHCERPEFEFIDIDLEGLRSNLADYIGKFLNVIAFETFPTRNPRYNSVPEEWEYEQPDRFDKVVKTIHELAENICTTYDDLIRLGRRKLCV